MLIKLFVTLQYNIFTNYYMNIGSATIINRDSTLIQKIIRLENQRSPRHDLVKIFFQYLPRTRELNLSKAMKQLAQIGFPIQNSQLFYWEYDKKMFVYIGIYPFEGQYYLKSEKFQENIIHIRYKKIQPQSQIRGTQSKIERENNITSSSRMQIQSTEKKNTKRVKQRSIEEVIKLVAKWRYLYQKIDCNNKKIYTLESAARQVGISKKTLDDYYLQLKYAQTYNFDFEYNKDAKIGILRAFAKLHHKGTKKKSEFIPLFNKAGHTNNGATNIKFAQDNAIAQPNYKCEDQDIQAYLFHKDHSCEFSDQSI